MTKTVLRTAILESPIGDIWLSVSEHGLAWLSFEPNSVSALPWLTKRFGQVELRTDPDPDGVISRLRAYLGGDLGAIEGVPVDLGGTPFQAVVWSALRDIPAGRTASYAEIARRVGRPAAVRAVGMANARNPVPIVIPCHRVVRSDGSLCGYGGGVERKRWLLRHEGARWGPVGPG